MMLGVLGWLVCGVILSLVATKLVQARGDDPRLTMMLGGVGGIVGGWMYSMISGAPIVLFNIWSLLFAAVAAVAALAIWHGVRSRTPYAGHTTRRSY